MNDSDLQNIIEAFNEAVSKLMIQDCAIRALVAQLSPEQGTAFAQDLQRHAASAMQAHAAHLSTQTDASMTLQLAAILASVGHPLKP